MRAAEAIAGVGRAAPPCRSGSAGWTRSRRRSGRPARPPAWPCGPGPARARRRCRPSGPAPRLLTSTAHTVASGESRAIASAIGPHPQPRSSRSPVAGSSGRLAQQHPGAQVDPLVAEDPALGPHRDVVPAQPQVDPAALTLAGRLLGEVVLRHGPTSSRSGSGSAGWAELHRHAQPPAAAPRAERQGAAGRPRRCAGRCPGPGRSSRPRSRPRRDQALGRHARTLVGDRQDGAAPGPRVSRTANAVPSGVCAKTLPSRASTAAARSSAASATEQRPGARSRTTVRRRCPRPAPPERHPVGDDRRRVARGRRRPVASGRRACGISPVTARSRPSTAAVIRPRPAGRERLGSSRSAVSGVRSRCDRSATCSRSWAQQLLDPGGQVVERAGDLAQLGRAGRGARASRSPLAEPVRDGGERR